MLKINILQIGKGFFKKEILYDTDRVRTFKVYIFGICIFQRDYHYTISILDETNKEMGYGKKQTTRP